MAKGTAYLKMTSTRTGSAYNGLRSSNTWIPWSPILSVTRVHPSLRGRTKMLQKQEDGVLTRIFRKPEGKLKTGAPTPPCECKSPLISKSEQFLNGWTSGQAKHRAGARVKGPLL